MTLGRNIETAQVEIAAFCRRWHIRELAVFGSALREDFGLCSDLDILVTFEPDVECSLFLQARLPFL